LVRTSVDDVRRYRTDMRSGTDQVIGIAARMDSERNYVFFGTDDQQCRRAPS
jgi:hypothetical protein